MDPRTDSAAQPALEVRFGAALALEPDEAVPSTAWRMVIS